MIGSSLDSVSWTVIERGLVFVTSAAYAGGNLGGVLGADAICAQHATDAGLGGAWTAWLSNSTINAKDRLVAAGALGPYRNTREKIVALDLNDLTDGQLDISTGGFRYDENGQETNTRRYVWTGTNSDGTEFLGGSCGTDWNDVGALGLVGDRNQDDSGWTRATFPPTVVSNRAVMCLAYIVSRAAPHHSSDLYDTGFRLLKQRAVEHKNSNLIPRYWGPQNTL